MSDKKLVKRSIAIGLGIICILLIASIGVAIAYYATTSIGRSTTTDQLRFRLIQLENAISSLTTTINQLRSNLTDLTHKLQNTTGNLAPYQSIDFGEINITSGLAYRFEVPDINSPEFCGGFSDLSVYYYIDDVSQGDFNLTVRLSAVEWFDGRPGFGGQYGGPMTIESLDSLKTTIIRHSDGSFDGSYPEPIRIQTKAPFFILGFSTSTDSPNWQNIWVRIHVFAYLRN